MQGLRDNDPTINDAFLRFFSLVQEEARRMGCVFFLYTGDGDVEQVGDLECETLSGWLVDSDLVDEFEPIWASGSVGSEFDNKLVTVDWQGVGDGVDISLSSVSA